MSDDVVGRAAAVRTAVVEAARRVGRDAAAIRIIAVTKTFPPAAVLWDMSLAGTFRNIFRSSPPRAGRYDKTQCTGQSAIE